MASSRGGEYSFVVAVLESRGIGREESVATLDRDTGTMDLIQVRFGFQVSSTESVEYHLFHFTARGWAIITRRLSDLREDAAPHEPPQPGACSRYVVDVSAPASAKFAASKSLLVQCIQDEFSGVPIEPVLRKYWNEEAGKCLVTFSEGADEAGGDYMRDFLFGY